MIGGGLGLDWLRKDHSDTLLTLLFFMEAVMSYPHNMRLDCLLSMPTEGQAVGKADVIKSILLLKQTPGLFFSHYPPNPH